MDDAAYRGPLVQAELSSLSPEAADPVLCRALIDTGAHTSIVDVDRVVGRLGLPQLDVSRLELAGRGRTEVAIVEVGLWFPDFGFARRRARVASLALPAPFCMLVGMDLLEGSRLALEVGTDGHWLRWEPLGP